MERQHRKLCSVIKSALNLYMPCRVLTEKSHLCISKQDQQSAKHVQACGVACTICYPFLSTQSIQLPFIGSLTACRSLLGAEDTQKNQIVLPESQNPLGEGRLDNWGNNFKTRQKQLFCVRRMKKWCWHPSKRCWGKTEKKTVWWIWGGTRMCFALRHERRW